MSTPKSIANCKKSLREISPDTIPDQEVSAFVDKVAALKESEAKKGVKGNFRKAVKEMLDHHRMELASQRAEKAANIMATQTRMNYYTQFGEGVEGKRKGMQMADAMKSKLGGGQQLKPGINDSISLNKNNLYNDYSAFVSTNLEQMGLWKVFTDGGLEREIMMEMHEIKEGGRPGISKSTEAKQIADVLHALQKRQIGDLKSTGLNIGEVDNYIMKQSHDRMKIREAGPEAWKTKVLEQLDHEKTFGLDAGNPSKMHEYLDAAYEHIVNGKFEIEDPDLIKTSDELITTANYSKLGDQITKSRQLYFKDGASFYEYNKEYGVASLTQALHRQMRATGRNVALINEFGSNPDAAFAADKVRIRKSLKNDPEALKAFDSSMDGIDNLYKQVRGQTSIPVDETMAKVASGIRGFNNLVALGGTTLRSLPDLMAGIAMTSSATGKSMFHTTGDMAGAFMQSLPNHQRAETAKLIGLFIKDHFSEVSQITGADTLDRLPGGMAKASNLFFKTIGLEYWTETTRLAPALMLSREAAIHSEMKFGDLTPQYRMNMERYGIDDSAWGHIQKAVDTLPDGSQAIIADNIKDRKVQMQWKNYLQDNAEFSAPNPTDRVRARINRGTQAGTLAGEAFRFIGQFKAFPLFGYDTGLRILASNPEKPLFYFRDVLKGQGDMQRLTGYMLGATALAYAGDAALSIAKNETPAPLDDPWTYKKAFQLSGAAGLYGDILLGDAQRLQQGGLLSQLAGPTASKVVDISKISSSMMIHGQQALANGESVMDKTQRDQLDAFNFLVRQAPGNNIFYLKTAMDQLLLDRIRGTIDDGYEQRKAESMAKRGVKPLINF